MDDIAITYLVTQIRTLHRRIGDLRARGEQGSVTTETVIIVAGLAALALAVVAIIVTKVTAKANSIPTN